MQRLVLKGAVLGSALLFVRPAAADATTEEEALASALFKDAKALLDEGRVPEACRKLEESQRLVPAGGTLLNLAVCHEREGKTATAYAELQLARHFAERDGRTDRIELADEHLRVLEPLLSTLTIAAESAANAEPSLEVSVDGRVVRRPAWGTAMPVDPGTHTIEASAPGKRSWSMRVDVAAQSDRRTIEIPLLVADDPAPAPMPSAPLTEPAARRDLTPAIVVGGFAVTSIAVGTFFGVRTLVKKREAEDACITNPCSAASKAINDDAVTAADISTVAFAVGAVGLGVATFLWLTAKPNAPNTRARAVNVGPGILSGVF